MASGAQLSAEDEEDEVEEDFWELMTDGEPITLEWTGEGQGLACWWQ